ncbi:hypothetical protein NP233_g9411 [Leucocoprinus birnbaumii]|uniref:Ricin B lectin domain-containing protein n=1 Tax=Leucocoprinus birnbaumii TaxID=56174 RepID=A0AAD5YN78_9AGAR|nr:hypothetical protein NP233_g9411 [Leucocoprinus birnbaumii]
MKAGMPHQDLASPCYPNANQPEVIIWEQQSSSSPQGRSLTLTVGTTLARITFSISPTTTKMHENGQVILYPLNKGKNQQWQFQDGYIINVESGMCLGIRGTDEKDIKAGALVVQGAKRTGSSSLLQLWVINTIWGYITPWYPTSTPVALTGLNNTVASSAVAAVEPIDFSNVGQQWTLVNASS